MPDRIVAKAHAEADLSGAGDVDAGETAWRRGRDAGTVAKFARELAEHGGDPEAAGVAARDLSPALPRGVPGRLPGAGRDDGHFHVTRLATRQLGGAGSAEARESRERTMEIGRASCRERV